MTRTSLAPLAAALAGALLCGPGAARAAEPMKGMGSMTMDHGAMAPPAGASTAAQAPSPQTPAAQTPAAKAYAAANEAMMKGMDVKPTGDADRDFVGMMLPHHQGAIDMARVEVQYGRDPMLRKLAADIVAAQEKEIVEMRAWREKHPGAR